MDAVSIRVPCRNLKLQEVEQVGSDDWSDGTLRRFVAFHPQGLSGGGDPPRVLINIIRRLAFQQLLSRVFSAAVMEEHNSKNSLQASPLAINWIANNASALLGNLDMNPHYVVNSRSNGRILEHLQVPQWMHYQPMPQNFVEFLAEKGSRDFQKEMPYDISAQVPCLGLASKLENYLMPHSEGGITTTVAALENQIGIQKQILNEECSHTFDTHQGSSSDASKYRSEAQRKSSRDKVCTAARRRRLRISYWLDALQELVPHAEVVDRAALLDNVMDYIKFLQIQMKDLCQSRLGGESTSDSVISLEDGHYFVQDQMLNGPLEEMMGKLIDAYPSEATEILQRRGLVVMPMTHAEGLLEEMLDAQGKGAFLFSK